MSILRFQDSHTHTTTPTLPRSPSGSKTLSAHSLADKIQVIAFYRPLFLTALTQVVDRMLENIERQNHHRANVERNEHEGA